MISRLALKDMVVPPDEGKRPQTRLNWKAQLRASYGWAVLCAQRVRVALRLESRTLGAALAGAGRREGEERERVAQEASASVVRGAGAPLAGEGVPLPPPPGLAAIPCRRAPRGARTYSVGVHRLPSGPECQAEEPRNAPEWPEEESAEPQQTAQ